MKPTIVLLLGTLLASSLSAQTAQSVGLYNTGIVDGTYTLVSGPTGFTGGLYEPNSGVYPMNGSWMANNPGTTEWLAIYSGTTAPSAAQAVAATAGGTYNIGLTFDLSSVPSHADVSFDINVAVDNNLAVSLNSIALTDNNGTPALDGDNNYNSLSHYAFHVTGANLQTGSNSLNFAVTNISGPSGLYVQYSNFTVIPEPSTYAMLLGAATLGLALLRRRFRR